MNLGVQVVKEEREEIEMVGLGPQACMRGGRGARDCRRYEIREEWCCREIQIHCDGDMGQWKGISSWGIEWVSDLRVMGINQSG